MEQMIGSVRIGGPLVLGPMAGVTDHPFRQICREMGASLVATEMVSANAIRYGNRKTFTFIDIGDEEHPVSLQLFGPDPSTIGCAIEALREYPYDILDLNMGCPMPKIVKNGEGSALMRDLPLAEAIIREAVRRSDRPVTVKMRAGFMPGERTAVELARRAEAAGAAAVAVHGRTREQYYTGRADWTIIREVREAVSIPVIGNGDVTSGEMAEEMRKETGCDLVMIARGARGNPWIFTGQKGRPPIRDVHALILRHTRMQLEEKGDWLGICQMRKHIAWYTTGYPGSAALRDAVNTAKSYEEIREMLDRWLEAALRDAVS